MKQCKYCKTEIDDKAKNCPQCGKSQKSGCGTILIICLLVILLAILIPACTGYNKKKDESNAKTGTVSIESSESSASGKVEKEDNSKQDESSSEEAEKPDKEQTEKSDEIKQEANQLIYDANGIKITYKGFSQGGLFENASFDFLVENNSDKDIRVSSDKVSLNDFTISNFLYEDIGAGKKCNSGVNIYDYELEQNDIEKINKVEFTLKFIDPETYHELFVSDKITITLDENAEIGGVPEGSQLIYEQGGIFVYYVKNTGSTWISDDGIKFFVQNDTDQNVVVKSDDVTVNDFTMNSATLYADVEAHKKTNDIMELYSSEMEDNGITDIEKVDFTLRCYDSDTYDDIWETDTITITME